MKNERTKRTKRTNETDGRRTPRVATHDEWRVAARSSVGWRSTTWTWRSRCHGVRVVGVDLLILVGEREISNYSSHESLSGARDGYYAGRGARTKNEENGLARDLQREMLADRRVGMTSVVYRWPNRRSRGAVGAVTAPTSSRGGRRAGGLFGRA